MLQHIVAVAQLLLGLAAVLDLPGELHVERFGLLARLIQSEQQRLIAPAALQSAGGCTVDEGGGQQNAAEQGHAHQPPVGAGAVFLQQ